MSENNEELIGVNSLRTLKKLVPEIGKDDIFSAPLHLLKLKPGFNVRGAFYPGYWESEEAKAHIRGFAESYKKGLYVPPLVVEVVDGELLVTDGAHRYYGAKLAAAEGADLKRVKVTQNKGDEAAQTLLMMKSSQGRALNVIETAVCYDRLKNFGWKDEEIAKEFQKSPERVRQMLGYLDLPEQLITLIAQDKVAAETASAMFKKEGMAAVAKIEAGAIELEKATQTGKKPKRVTEANLAKKPRMTKKLTNQMHISLKSITSRLSVSELDLEADKEEFEFTLTRDELKALIALKGELEAIETAEEPEETSEEEKAETQLPLLDDGEE